jgi:hypothetical protein
VGRLVAVLGLAVLAGTAPAAAQATSPPGPWAIDVRGVTSPVPEDVVFYPPLAATARIPTRGFGLEGGAHVYLFNLGASRVGIGASALNVRAVTNPPPSPPTSSGSGTTMAPPRQSVQLDLRIVAPQLSFNFGTRNGWSYVSAGAGFGDVITRTAGASAGRRHSQRLNVMNVGGGARWFFLSHLAFGFDVRLHRVAAGVSGPIEMTGGGSQGEVIGIEEPGPPPPTPGKMILVVGVGLSVR